MEYKTETRKLFILQKRAIRILSRASRTTPSSGLFKELKLLKLSDIYNLRVAMIMHKINNNTWVGTKTIFRKVSSIHNYYTRAIAQDKYYTPTVTTNIAKNSFYYLGPKIYSEIPLLIRDMSNQRFKTHYSKFLINDY